MVGSMRTVRTGLDAFEGTTAHEVDLPAGRVRYYRAGTSGPAVILLHGGVLDSSELAYGEVVPRLSAHYRIYALDWPEHGHSWPWSAGTTEADFGDVLARMIRLWGLDRVNLVGMSQGGGLAIRYALDHPEQVDRVVAIGPVGFEDRRWVLTLMRLAVRLPNAPELATRLLARSPRLVGLVMWSARTHGKSTVGFDESVAIGHDQAEQAVRHGTTIVDDYLYQTYCRRSDLVDYRPDAPGLTVPTLIVQGQKDRSTSRRALIRAAAAMPDGRYRRLPGAGHLACRDEPEAMALVIREFLDVKR